MRRTYGHIQFVKKDAHYDDWYWEKANIQDYVIRQEALKSESDWGKPGYYFKMQNVEPHVCIKLKSIFGQLQKSVLNNFYFASTDNNCHDLLWFIDRYPLQMDATTEKKLKAGNRRFLKTQAMVEYILSDEYVPASAVIKEPYQPRPYQQKAAQVFMETKKMLLLDELGLGKSLTATLPIIMFPQKTLPAMIVCQTHLPTQWKAETIEKFTNLSVFIVPVGLKATKKNLPAADVYICPYSRLTKWGDILRATVKYIIFDEVQELRCTGSEKYNTSQNLCDEVNYVMGLSGSPIYNYGIEMFNILDCINRGAVGNGEDWGREWGWKEVRDTKALGTFLREVHLVVRRTDKEVGRELPQLNTIVTTVEYSESEVERENKLAKQLALSYLTSTSFAEKGSLARELDARLRQITGIAKAHAVADLVKILLETGHPVLLSGWHRDVYDIWLTDLIDYKPVMYTGSETNKQKDEAKRAFINGETNLMIISNRSGVGLDGLQYRCRDVVIGELDWSPQVHKQITGRVNRDGQKEHVTVYFPICDYGSDEAMVEVLGLKSEQAQQIIDPHLELQQQHTDESRIKILAETYLRKNGIDPAKLQTVINETGELDIQEKKDIV